MSPVLVLLDPAPAGVQSPDGVDGGDQYTQQEEQEAWGSRSAGGRPNSLPKLVQDRDKQEERAKTPVEEEGINTICLRQHVPINTCVVKYTSISPE